jgi:class 3 adenylate cyclase
MEDLDPEEARRIVDPALKLMVEAVRRYGDYIPQSTGDGIFAVFGAPVAHKDHPLRALHAAAEDAGGAPPLLGQAGRRRRCAAPVPSRGEYWRGGC